MDVGVFINTTRNKIISRHIHNIVVTTWLADWLHTLPFEVEVIWPARWNLVKFLYFFNRYFPVDIIFSYIYIEVPDVEMCRVSYFVSSVGLILALGMSEVQFFVVQATAFSLLGPFLTSFRWVPSPVPKHIACLAVAANTLYAAISFAMIMVNETIIMLVMLYIGFMRHRHTRSSLVKIFYRDGFVFFLFLAASSIVNIAMLASLPLNYEENEIDRSENYYRTPTEGDSFSGSLALGPQTAYSQASTTFPAPRTMTNLDQHFQGTHMVQEQSVLYYQPHSNAPIFNGPVYGPIWNTSQIATVDGLQFLYQHAAMGAMHESDERFPPPLCCPGTREVVIGRVIGWYLACNGWKKEIMWIHAPAGYGKTAIAGTVKQRLEAMELGFESPVGATFYFWRTSAERNSPARFIITLACQLAQSIPEIRPSLEAAIKSRPTTVKMALEIQLVELIVKPFQSLSNFAALPNRLVVVDGIDECIESDRESRAERKYAEDQEYVQIRVLNLIHRLQSFHLPLSFLLLSRPEAWIKRHLEATPLCQEVEALDLYQVGDHLNDVKKFVRAELARISASFGFGEVDVEWEGEDALVRKSEGHMVHAATVVRHIDDEYGDPRALLRSILEGPCQRASQFTALSSLHDLYGQIMRSCPERNRGLMIEVLEDVIVFHSTRLTFRDLTDEEALCVFDELAGRPVGSGARALRPLHAVLQIGSTGASRSGGPFIHSSFREFLQDPQFSPLDTCKGTVRMLSRTLDFMAAITQDIDGTQMDNVTIFALANWCWLWRAVRGTASFHSGDTHLELIKKVSALDLTACIVRLHHSPEISRCTFKDEGPLDPLFDSDQGSSLFSSERGWWLLDLKTASNAESSLALKVVPSLESSLECAFSVVLKSCTLPAFPEWDLWAVACDFATYFRHVTSQLNWQEHKAVQALGHPGRKSIDLFEQIVEILYEWRWKWAGDLLEHTCKVMMDEENPILGEKDRQFLEKLRFNRKDFLTQSSISTIDGDGGR
ncbi:hypothetical protein MD484_g8726, partial [Candolleomyces efflorescens]